MTTETVHTRLSAGLEEDERVAREASGALWETGVLGRWIHVSAEAIAENKMAFGHLGYVGSIERDADRIHVARQDPARVLRHVEALRRVIAEHAGADGDGYCGRCLVCTEYDDGTTYQLPCPTIAALASIYTETEAGDRSGEPTS